MEDPGIFLQTPSITKLKTYNIRDNRRDPPQTSSNFRKPVQTCISQVHFTELWVENKFFIKLTSELSGSVLFDEGVQLAGVRTY